ENVSFLIFCYEVLGDQRLLDAISRGMNFFILAQQGPPQPGWALQYTLDLRPAAARTYEPLALATHTTAANIGHLISFYELTGDSRYIARVPEALDWLQARRLPAVNAKGNTHPTFIEIGSDKPLYVHRRGSNVVNGEYYVDYDERRTPGHYSGTRRIDVTALRKRYETALAKSPQTLARNSPLAAGSGIKELPRFFAGEYAPRAAGDIGAQVAAAVAGLNAAGYWPAPLKMTSHPYHGEGSKQVAPGDFATTHVGDDSDTSPHPDDHPVMGISTAEYLKNMNVLIEWLAQNPAR
ncbi:MAG TPA: hypothetical protein VKB34_20930, partial [Povalibacter sp.]|nr:hypothetical protein [Povalibacter sp.]